MAIGLSYILESNIKNFKNEKKLEETNIVLSMSDGIARCYYLTKIQAGKMVELCPIDINLLIFTLSLVISILELNMYILLFFYVLVLYFYIKLNGHLYFLYYKQIEIILIFILLILFSIIECSVFTTHSMERPNKLTFNFLRPKILMDNETLPASEITLDRYERIARDFQSNSNHNKGPQLYTFPGNCSVVVERGPNNYVNGDLFYINKKFFKYNYFCDFNIFEMVNQNTNLNYFNYNRELNELRHSVVLSNNAIRNINILLEELKAVINTKPQDHFNIITLKNNLILNQQFLKEITNTVISNDQKKQLIKNLDLIKDSIILCENLITNNGGTVLIPANNLNEPQYLALFSSCDTFLLNYKSKIFNYATFKKYN